MGESKKLITGGGNNRTQLERLNSRQPELSYLSSNERKTLFNRLKNTLIGGYEDWQLAEVIMPGEPYSSDDLSIQQLEEETRDELDGVIEKEIEKIDGGRVSADRRRKEASDVLDKLIRNARRKS